MSRPALLIAKAERRLAAARRDVAAEDYESCISRIYYAVFAAAQALLASEGLEAHTHKGVFTLLGRHFVKPGRLDKRHADVFRRARDARQLADYAEAAVFEQKETQRLLEEATAFADEARRLVVT